MPNIITSGVGKSPVNGKLYGQDSTGNAGFFNPGPNFKNDAARIKYFRVVETFDSAYGKTIALSANVAEDTTNKMFSRGYRATVTYDGAGNDEGYVEIAEKRIFDGSKPFILSVYVHESNANSKVGVMISNSSFSTDGPSAFLSIGVLEAGFYNIVIPVENWTMWGASDYISGPYAKMRIYMRQSSGSAGQVTDITFLGVFQGLTKPQFCLQFDDALQSVYTEAFPIFQAAGIVGSIAAIGELLGSSYGSYPVMSAAQISEMHSAGWEVCVHGTTAHGDGALTSEAAILTDINNNKNALAALGLTGSLDLYSFPGGGILTTDNASDNALASAGMSYARKNGGVVMSFLGEGISANLAPNPYRFPAKSLAQSGFTPNETIFESLLSFMDSGMSAIFFTHGVKDGAAVDSGREGTDITKTQLQGLVDRLVAYQNAGMCEIVTWREMLNTIPVNGVY